MESSTEIYKISYRGRENWQMFKVLPGRFSGELFLCIVTSLLWLCCTAGQLPANCFSWAGFSKSSCFHQAQLWGSVQELLPALIHLGEGGWESFILPISIESSVVKEHREGLGIQWPSLPCASAKSLLLHSGRKGQTQKSMSHIPGQGNNNFLFATRGQVYKTVFFW